MNEDKSMGTTYNIYYNYNSQAERWEIDPRSDGYEGSQGEPGHVRLIVSKGDLGRRSLPLPIGITIHNQTVSQDLPLTIPENENFKPFVGDPKGRIAVNPSVTYIIKRHIRGFGQRINDAVVLDPEPHHPMVSDTDIHIEC